MLMKRHLMYGRLTQKVSFTLIGKMYMKNIVLIISLGLFLPSNGAHNQSWASALTEFTQSMQTLKQALIKELQDSPRFIQARIQADLASLDSSDINELNTILSDIELYKKSGGTKDYSDVKTALEKKLELTELLQIIKTQVTNLDNMHDEQQLQQVLAYIQGYEQEGGTTDFSVAKKQINDRLTMLQLQDSIEVQEKNFDTITSIAVLQKLQETINRYVQLGGSKDFSALLKKIEEKITQPEKVEKALQQAQEAAHDYATTAQEVNSSLPATLGTSSAQYVDILDKFSSNNDVQLLPKAQLAFNTLSVLATQQLSIDQKATVKNEFIPMIIAANQQNIATLVAIDQHLQQLKKEAEHTANSYAVTNPFMYKDNPYRLLGITRQSISSIDDIDEAFASKTSTLSSATAPYKKLAEAKNYITTIYELEQKAAQASKDLANAQNEIKEYKDQINKLTDQVAQIKI